MTFAFSYLNLGRLCFVAGTWRAQSVLLQWEWCVSVVLAATIPHLDLMISLVGTMSSSAIALVFPPMLEIVTYWNEPRRYGRYRWRIGKDILIMLFGVLGFFIGTITTLINIVHAFTQPLEREPCWLAWKYTIFYLHCMSLWLPRVKYVPDETRNLVLV